MYGLSDKQWELWQKKRKKTMIGFVIIGTFGGIDCSVIVSTLYLYLKDLVKARNPTLWYGVITAVFFISSTIFGAFCGRWLDRTRRVSFYANMSLLLQVFGFILYTIPFHPVFILAGRIICGMGDPFTSVVAGEIFRIFDEKGSTRAMLWLASIYSFGFIIGPSLNIAFVGIDFNIGPMKINNLNFIGIFMAVLLFLVLLVSNFLVYDCSKELDLKAYLKQAELNDSEISKEDISLKNIENGQINDVDFDQLKDNEKDSVLTDEKPLRDVKDITQVKTINVANANINNGFVPAASDISELDNDGKVSHGSEEATLDDKKLEKNALEDDMKNKTAENDSVDNEDSSSFNENVSETVNQGPETEQIDNMDQKTNELNNTSVMLDSSASIISKTVISNDVGNEMTLKDMNEEKEIETIVKNQADQSNDITASNGKVNECFDEEKQIETTADVNSAKESVKKTSAAPIPVNIVLQHLLSSKDVLLIFCSTFTFVYGILAASAIVPIILNDILGWSLKTLCISYAINGIVDFGLLTILSRYFTSNRSVFYASVVSIICQVFICALLICFKFVSRDSTRDLLFVIAFLLLLSIGWFYDDVLSRVLLARFVPSQIQSFSETLRSGICRLAMVAGSFTVGVMMPWLHWWASVIMVVQIILLIVFVLRRKHLINPKEIPFNFKTGAVVPDVETSVL